MSVRGNVYIDQILTDGSYEPRGLANFKSIIYEARRFYFDPSPKALGMRLDRKVILDRHTSRPRLLTPLPLAQALGAWPGRPLL
jgi:hypothetical protein